MKRKLSVLLIIIITAIFYACHNDECDKLIVVIDTENPPYGFTNDDVIVGLDIDIVNEIAKEINCDVEVIALPFAEALLTIQKGEADILAASVVKTAERELIMNFSTPYYYSKQIVLKKNDNDLLISTKDINANTRVGVQQGTVGHMFAEEELECVIISFATIKEEIDALENGEIDCVIIDYATASYLVAHQNGFEIIDEALFDYGMSLIIQKENYKLLETANSVINNLVNNGKIDELMKDYLE